MLDWIAHAAISHPDNLALIHGDRHWSYAALNEDAGRMAGHLAAAGISAGDHVGVLMPNRVEYVLAIHALTRLGAVLVPLNTRLTSSELQWQFDHADCTFLLCSEETEGQARSLSINSQQFMAHDQLCYQIFSADSRRTSEVTSVEAAPAQMVAFRSGRRLDLDATQSIVFTSGTTGRPKGAMLTYGNHLASATASAFRLGTLARDRWLNCLPLYHLGGLSIIFRCCLYGTTVVLQAGFDTEVVNQALDTQDITLISLVPTMLQWILEARDERPFSESLRCVLLGGAGAPPALVEKCLSLDVPIALSYGLTETSSQVVTASPADVRRKARCVPRWEPGYYVGKPLMFCAVKIIGEKGEDQLAGAIGEIVVRGPTVMKGYYRQPQAGPHTLGDDGLHTGDVGYVDPAGDLWIVQRRVDLIVSGGENVYPSEVEQVLLAHPEVKRACVIGLPDEAWGQRVAVAVVLNQGATLTEDDLVDFCRERLAGYKLPRVIRFVASLPETSSGKIIRGAVADLFRK